MQRNPASIERRMGYLRKAEILEPKEHTKAVKDRHDQIRQMDRLGLSGPEIAERMGISRQYVYLILHRARVAEVPPAPSKPIFGLRRVSVEATMRAHGIVIPSNRTKALRHRIEAEARQGKSAKQIASELGMSQSYVSRLLREAGIHRRLSSKVRAAEPTAA